MDRRNIGASVDGLPIGQPLLKRVIVVCAARISVILIVLQCSLFLELVRNSSPATIGMGDAEDQRFARSGQMGQLARYETARLKTPGSPGRQIGDL